VLNVTLRLDRGERNTTADKLFRVASRSRLNLWNCWLTLGPFGVELELARLKIKGNVKLIKESSLFHQSSKIKVRDTGKSGFGLKDDARQP